MAPLLESLINLLRAKGFSAQQNVTIAPSLTAAAHIAIATGSIAAANDVVSNTFHLVASPFTFNISGFSAPIGGYLIDGPAQSPELTAVPLWRPLLENNKTVATATWPGGDGLNVTVPGRDPSIIVQPAAERTVTYTVPFGAATAPFQKGFNLTTANFSSAPAQTIADLISAGHTSYSPVLQADLETFSSGGQSYSIKAVALDTTNDSTTNYDTLVMFDANHGSILGPFTAAPLGTGPAYIQPSTKISALFYLEGHSNKGGSATSFRSSRPIFRPCGLRAALSASFHATLRLSPTSTISTTTLAFGSHRQISELSSGSTQCPPLSVVSQIPNSKRFSKSWCESLSLIRRTSRCARSHDFRTSMWR
jgi:hypothetical protein